MPNAPITTLTLCCLVAASIATFTGFPTSARADQPRDFMVAPAQEGAFLNADVVFPGLQIGIENNRDIYGGSNSLSLTGSALLAVPFAQTRAEVALRLLILTLAVGGGYHQDLHLLTFEPGEPIDRKHRRTLDRGAIFDEAGWPFLDLRAGLALPFNDHLVWTGTATARFAARPERSFDWESGVVRDAGPLLQGETILLLKARSLGAAGPVGRLLHYGYAGESVTQLTAGFALLTRPGLLRRRDLFVFQMLFDLGTARIAGYGSRDVYGAHAFKGPFTFLVAYRMIFPL